jgi:hypothetical protein
MRRLLHALLTVCLTACCALTGLTQGGSADSLWVKGGVITSADSIHATLDWRLNGRAPLPGLDTVWSRLPRTGGLVAWAKTDSTQAQLEAPWPRWTDSVVFSLFLDSAGLGLQLMSDTLMASWAPLQSGCFPASSDRDLKRLMGSLSELPFESRRFALAAAWMQDHCLTPLALRRLADGFDDEGRRLQLLQSATLTTPDALPSLSSLFFTTRYQDEFLQWLEQQRPAH